MSSTDNEASWATVAAYYDFLCDMPQWKSVKPILRLVDAFGRSERAAQFHASNELSKLIVSTGAVKAGSEGQRYFTMATGNVVFNVAETFEVALHEGGDTPLEIITCSEADLRKVFAQALAWVSGNSALGG